MELKECSGDDFVAAVREVWESGESEPELWQRIRDQIATTVGRNSDDYNSLVIAGAAYFDAVRAARDRFLLACREAVREQRKINLNLERRLGLGASAEEPVFNAPSPKHLGEQLRQVALWYGGEIEALQRRFHHQREAFEEACTWHHVTFLDEIVASHERRGITHIMLDAVVAGGDLPPEDDQARGIVGGCTAVLAEVVAVTTSVQRVVAAAPEAWNAH